MNTNGTSTYTYDAENRLVSTAGVTYTYDGEGNRVVKLGGTSSTIYWRGADGETANETDTANAILHRHVYFAGRRVFRSDTAPWTPHYYLSDHLGSANVVVGLATTGNPPPLVIENESDFVPFGGERIIQNNVAQNYKFTGKERDAESDLDEFGARYYASSIGRFMTPDWAAKPINVPYANFGNPQSLNLYSYVENNPTTVGDPDGHCCDWLVNVFVGAAKGLGNMAMPATNASNAIHNALFPSKPALPTNLPSYAYSNTTQTVSGTVAQGAVVAGTSAIGVPSETAVGLAPTAGSGVAANSQAALAAPSLVGFGETETAMIGQSMNTLSGIGYDLSPLQTLIKADMPAGTCGMCLSGSPTGAALGDGAFSSQQMLDHTLEEELLHLNQNLSGQTFGPGDAAAKEAEVNVVRRIPEPPQ